MREPDRLTSDADADLDDEVVRWVMTVTSPAYGLTMPALKKSAAQLQSEAETSWAYRLRRLLIQADHGLGSATAALSRRAVLVAALAAVAVIVTEGRRPVVAGPGTPAPLDLELPEGRPAAADLITFAAGVSLLPAVIASAQSYIHLQRWSLDDTPGDTAGNIVAQEVQTWWSPDRSGRQVITTLPPQPAGQTVAKWLVNPRWHIPRSRTQAYLPGEYHTVPVTGAPSADPGELSGQLADQEPPTNGPQATVRAIATLHEHHRLTPAQRVAVLKVLAQTPTLTYHGHVTDRAGRAGVAFSVLSRNGTRSTRDILVFEPGTGVLLSHEEVILKAPNEKLNTPVVRSYVLYLGPQELPD